MSRPRCLACAALLTVLAIGAGAIAGDFVIGRYAGEFLSLGAGARALAMGGASTANPTSASSVYYNPSALAGIEKHCAEFMHAAQFDNTYTYDYLAYVQPMPHGQAGGITMLYTRVGDIPMTKLSDPNAPLSDENRVLVDRKTGDHELALLAAMGRRIGTAWKAGAGAKLLYKTVADESAAGVGFDIGVGRSVAKGLEFGAAVHDITTSVLAWSTGRTEAILPSVQMGGAWQFPIRAANAEISLAADLDGHFESRGEAEQMEAGPLSVEPRIGLEYLIARTVALRGGFNGDNMTAGAGIHLAWLNVGAAFQNHQDLGLTHRVSVAVTW